MSSKIEVGSEEFAEHLINEISQNQVLITGDFEYIQKNFKNNLQIFLTNNYSSYKPQCLFSTDDASGIAHKSDFWFIGTYRIANVNEQKILELSKNYGLFIILFNYANINYIYVWLICSRNNIVLRHNVMKYISFKVVENKKDWNDNLQQVVYIADATKEKFIIEFTKMCLKTFNNMSKMTRETVIDYLTKMAPYIKKIRTQLYYEKLNMVDKCGILLLAHEQDKLYGFAKPIPDDLELDGSCLDDLCELYMFFHGRYKCTDEINCCVNIHDGWTIARILDFNPRAAEQKNQIINHKESTPDGTKVYNLTDHTEICEALLNRGNAEKIIINNQNVKCRDVRVQITETIANVNIDTVIRGDQLSMFVDYHDLDESEALKDKPAYNIIKNMGGFAKLVSNDLKNIFELNDYQKENAKQYPIEDHLGGNTRIKWKSLSLADIREMSKAYQCKFEKGMTREDKIEKLKKHLKKWKKSAK